MPTLLRLLLPLCLALILPATAVAQSNAQTAARQSGPGLGSMPVRGMEMQQVRRLFGEPAQRLHAVGDPPIRRWQYDGMMVYFEDRRVIHSVATSEQPQ